MGSAATRSWCLRVPAGGRTVRGAGWCGNVCGRPSTDALGQCAPLTSASLSASARRFRARPVLLPIPSCFAVWQPPCAIATGNAELGYGDPRGSELLRRQVATHLAASRNIRCDPGCIVIVGNTQQGLRLCAEALLRPGDGVWFEDPGYPVARRSLEAAGFRSIQSRWTPTGSTLRPATSATPSLEQIT
ncbi:aminotransferase class I/II-fold pyridoxal phosphate-dependent enzyme [Methylobacterium crusticola]|uniref:aminotransferase class I/II-fold pyridoxal phosphate-dependent enzyme n=1 Tax=Methylobacterium crusticola TaxID=1697972 RepID=UPI000FFC57D7